MHQPELAAAPDRPIGTDPFERIRAKYPNDRLLLIVDRRSGREGDKYLAIAEPGSRWFDLLPPQQIIVITEAPNAPLPTAQA